MCVWGGVRLNYLWFLGVGWWVIAFSLYFDGGVKESFENGSQPPPPPPPPQMDLSPSDMYIASDNDFYS